MNHLYRELAPITADTWSALDDEARTRLAPALGARRLVDFAGPFGWTYSSTSIGRVTAVVPAPVPDVVARSRVVLPLAEVRAPFSLAREELDATARGAVDTDLSPLDAAASRIATAENAAVFGGWDAAGIAGIIPTSPHAPLARPEHPAHLAEVVASAVAVLDRAGVGGPYGLALDTPGWTSVMGGSDAGGAPLERHVRTILGGDIAWVPGIDGAVVVSQRGGDFLFESGQDISLGYAAHDADAVALYLEESFSFRIATPEAAVAIR